MVAYLSGTDLAVAGHAVALAGWHQVMPPPHVKWLWYMHSNMQGVSV